MPIWYIFLYSDGVQFLTCLNTWLGATATVKVEAVDWTSISTASNGPRTISEEDRPITNNVLTVSVTGCNDTSGYRIYITPQR